MLVRKLMTPSPLTVAPGDRLDVALGVMLSNDIHTLPVLAGDTLVGIVTRRDLQVAIGPDARNAELELEAGHDNRLRRAVREVMSTDVQTLGLNDSAAEACRLLVSLRVGAVPVVDKEGRLRGILSVTDLLAVAAELFEKQPS